MVKVHLDLDTRRRTWNASQNSEQRRVLLAELDAEMRANNQISVIDATHRDVERVAYSPLACIAGCGDVPAAKKLGSS